MTISPQNLADIKATTEALICAYRERYRRHPEQMADLLTGEAYWRGDVSLVTLDSLFETATVLRDAATDPILKARYAAAYEEIGDLIAVKEVEAEYRANRFAGWGLQ